MSKKRLSRRGLLAGLCATAGVVALPSLLNRRKAHSAPTEGPPPKFLIVFGAFGGASIIDSFLPLSDTEALGPDVNSYPDAAIVQPNGSNIRAVTWAGSLIASPYVADFDQFIVNHGSDMVVATHTGTSVNHTVAQKRAITGNGVNNGRTIQEAVAASYGADCPIPNVNMSSGGYAAHGDDGSLPTWAYMEPVNAPLVWPLALHGSRGVKLTEGGKVIDGPDPELVQLARNVRNNRLDPESSFYTTFQLSQNLQRWKQQRNNVQPDLEDAELISKTNILTDDLNIPLSEYDLLSSPDAAKVQQAFPRFLRDPLHAQAALAFLLIKHRVSVSVTIGPNFNLVLGDPNQGDGVLLNPPLSFDNSHTDHRNTQLFMWKRMLDVIDSLINLLKAEEFDRGESYWDRTMIYCASDFGRDKKKNGGTGHNLNNGNLLISPMLKGNQVLGGVAADGNTYGFDLATGAPLPNEERAEGDIYSGIVGAMDVDTAGATPTATAFHS